VSPWLGVLGLFAAAVLAALVLKRLPHLVVLALLVAAVAYANHVLIGKPKRERALATAQALGMRPVPDEEAGLRALPFALLTPLQERPDLPVCAVTSEQLAGRFEVRCEEPDFARSFLDGPVAGWLTGEGEQVGLELAGSGALLHRSWVPAKDRDLVLEAVSGFLAAVPAGRSSGGR
jgi:hypothetical protein